MVRLIVSVLGFGTEKKNTSRKWSKNTLSQRTHITFYFLSMPEGKWEGVLLLRRLVACWCLNVSTQDAVKSTTVPSLPLTGRENSPAGKIKKKRKTELRTVLSDRWSSVTVTRKDMLETTHAPRNGKLTIPRNLSPFMGSEILLKQTIIFIFRFLLSVYWIV